MKERKRRERENKREKERKATCLQIGTGRPNGDQPWAVAIVYLYRCPAGLQAAVASTAPLPRNKGGGASSSSSSFFFSTTLLSLSPSPSPSSSSEQSRAEQQRKRKKGLEEMLRLWETKQLKQQLEPLISSGSSRSRSNREALVSYIKQFWCCCRFFERWIAACDPCERRRRPTCNRASSI